MAYKHVLVVEITSQDVVDLTTYPRSIQYDLGPRCYEVAAVSLNEEVPDMILGGPVDAI